MSKKHSSRVIRFLGRDGVVLISFLGMCMAIFPKEAFSFDSANPEKYHLNALHIDRKVDMTGKLSDPLWKLAEPARHKL